MRVVLGVLAASVLCAPALAQTAPSTWNELPERVRVDTGYFRLGADTVLRLDAVPGSGDVDFERDLGVAEDVDTFWLDATWRVGRRHQLELGFTRLQRDREGFSLQRQFTWGGETYDAGLEATTTTGADILGSYYRFAAFRSDRFEIGPTVGVGYLWLDARVAARGTIGGLQRELDRSASTSSITGAVGGYATAWPAKRLATRADFLYMKVSPGDSDASVTDWRLGADYYFVRNAGLGVQYKYNRYSYDRGVLVSQLGGEITYQGFQAFLSFLF